MAERRRPEEKAPTPKGAPVLRLAVETYDSGKPNFGGAEASRQERRNCIGHRPNGKILRFLKQDRLIFH